MPDSFGRVGLRQMVLCNWRRAREEEIEQAGSGPDQKLGSVERRRVSGFEQTKGGDARMLSALGVSERKSTRQRPETG
jgi:hypothetical protein